MIELRKPTTERINLMSDIKYPMYLGIKLTKAENKALLNIARREGISKSSYARHILRAQLIDLGALTFTDPAPQVDEITAQGPRKLSGELRI